MLIKCRGYDNSTRLLRGLLRPQGSNDTPAARLINNQHGFFSDIVEDGHTGPIDHLVVFSGWILVKLHLFLFLINLIQCFSE